MGGHHKPFPIGPLLPLVAARGCDAEACGRLAGRSTTAAARQWWNRAVRAGWLSVDEADRIACGLGYHPASIWPHWWLEVAHPTGWPAAREPVDVHVEWIIHLDRPDRRPGMQVAS